jgi:hypothetical protein
MDAKRFAVGTVAGGITLFVLAYLFFDLVLGTFYTANAGPATAVDRGAPVIWAVVVGTLAYAALITLAIERVGSSSIGSGVAAGALVGFLLFCTADFTLYGLTNIANLTRTLVDPVVEAIRGGIGGGVIAVVLEWTFSSSLDARQKRRI